MKHKSSYINVYAFLKMKIFVKTNSRIRFRVINSDPDPANYICLSDVVSSCGCYSGVLCLVAATPVQT